MKKTFCYSSVFCLMLLTTACSRTPDVSAPVETQSVSETIATEVDTTEVDTTENAEIALDETTMESKEDQIETKDTVMESYRKVLADNGIINEAGDYYTREESGWEGKQTPFQESNYYTQIRDMATESDKDPVSDILFTVVDLDSDGTPEVVLEGPNIGEHLVLHYADGTVYGFSFPYRGMNTIKQDGSFAWSGGAGYSGYSKLQFISNYYEKTELALVDFDNQQGYFVDGIQVSDNVFKDFTLKQDEKEDVDWFEMTEDNMNTILK